MTTAEKLNAHMRVIPDFPKPGISFKDITPILADSQLFNEMIELFADKYRTAGITKVVGMEARGFLFAAPLAVKLGAGMVPVRKKGKLPYETVAETYALEYGTDTLEMHKDAVGPADKVLIIDDVLATGGTAAAAVRLVEKLGAKIEGVAFLMELEFLHGRDKLAGQQVFSAIKS